MLSQFYVITVSSNVECENDFSHHILKGFINYEDALIYLNNIDKCIKNKTYPMFKSQEWGWLNPIEEEWTFDGKIYKWINPNSGETCYSKFIIERVEID